MEVSVNKFFISCITLVCFLPVYLVSPSQGPEASIAAAPVPSMSQPAPIDVGFWRKLAAQHPYIANLVQTVFKLSSCFESPDLLSLVLYNPTYALQVIDNIRSKFIKEVETMFPFISDPLIGQSLEPDSSDKQTLYCGAMRRYETLIHDYESKCPLMLLGECTQDGYQPCTLSRMHNLHREQYETRLITALCAKIDQAHGLPVHYVSFGSGSLFQDLVILSKVLAQKPDATLAIHFIDVEFTDYVTMCNELDSSKLFVGRNLIPEAIFDCARKIVQRYPDKPTTQVVESREGDKIFRSYITTDPMDDKPLIFAYVTGTAEMKEISSWLIAKFPAARLAFYIHNSGSSYIKYLEQQKLPAPDVITTADIQDDSGETAIPDYVSVCRYALTHKPSAYNLWLAKEFVNGYPSEGVILVQLSLKAALGATENTFKSEDGSEVHIFVTEEKISPKICDMCGDAL